MNTRTLITGATGGIGRATALGLSCPGGALGLIARTEPAIEALAAEVRARGGEAHPFPGSVLDPDFLAAAAAEFERRAGPVDALVNCAGAGAFAPVEGTSLQEWERILGANLTGTFLACRAVLPSMLRRGSGQIINVASIAGKVAFPNAAAYCASKWGVLGFTRVLAAEVRARGLRVTALCPGSVDTSFWDAVESAPERSQMLRPEEVAETIASLLAQPPGVFVDEIEILPPRGIL